MAFADDMVLASNSYGGMQLNLDIVAEFSKLTGIHRDPFRLVADQCEVLGDGNKSEKRPGEAGHGPQGRRVAGQGEGGPNVTTPETLVYTDLSDSEGVVPTHSRRREWS